MFFLRKILKVASMGGKPQLCSTKMRSFLGITIYYAFEGEFGGRGVVGHIFMKMGFQNSSFVYQ